MICGGAFVRAARPAIQSMPFGSFLGIVWVLVRPFAGLLVFAASAGGHPSPFSAHMPQMVPQPPLLAPPALARSLDSFPRMSPLIPPAPLLLDSSSDRRPPSLRQTLFSASSSRIRLAAQPTPTLPPQNTTLRTVAYTVFARTHLAPFPSSLFLSLPLRLPLAFPSRRPTLSRSGFCSQNLSISHPSRSFCSLT